MKSFLGSLPGIEYLVIGFGILIGLFILICYISLVVSINEEEDALEQLKKEEKRKEREQNADDI